MEIKTLKQFIEVIEKTVSPRKELVKGSLGGQKPNPGLINQLRLALDLLQKIPKENSELILELDAGKTMKIEAGYEINELEKDLRYFEFGEQEFNKYLDRIHEDFNAQVSKGVEFINNVNFTNFITDRDGTVNNYCARYNTSVQPAYNAIYLSRFAATKGMNSVLLTSAPLENKGLADISVLPQGDFILAGSKGREYIDMNGKKGNYPIEPEKQQILDELNKRLIKLVNEQEYEVFSRIGSGLQFKFGQTTIARQDINKTIDDQRSTGFLNKIKLIVEQVDPDKQNLKIEDTGLDIEIILTIKDSASENVKDFDKGDGVLFLDRDLGLNFKKGPNLVCGDTNSDVPMVEKSVSLTPDTYAVFVTTNDNLKSKVRNVCEKSLFVDAPDMLITMLNQIALKNNYGN